MDSLSILNYQGSKKNLLDFIHHNTAAYINPSTTILDVFSGSGSVGYSYKKQNKVYANDSEYFSYIIATALLSNYETVDQSQLFSAIETSYYENKLCQRNEYLALSKIEQELIIGNRQQDLIDLYTQTPTIWNNHLQMNNHHNCFELFTTYYSNSYFGINQAIDIDSLRYAFEQFRSSPIYFALLASLFYAMKECVFSKDGHMAQPLACDKNKVKLLKVRQKSITALFYLKLREFLSDDFISSTQHNKTFHLNFQDLLKLDAIKNEVDFIYADPPYTDMQYSRYYHLLNVVATYEYLKPTLIANKPTKGLYLEGRYQSKLSSKRTSLSAFQDLIDFSKTYKKDLAISFAYPQNVHTQRTDRYVMRLDDLISCCRAVFGNANVTILSENYSHSNHRNSEAKKVLEYLILCHGNLR